MAQKILLTDGERTVALKKAAKMLNDAGNVLILTHKSPDGDTMGSAFALCRALKMLGKTASVICSDPFPKKYSYLFDGPQPVNLEPELVVATDIADVELMGKQLEAYAGRVGLCIDHHPSNTGYADFTVVDPTAAATCEVMTEIIDLLGVEIDRNIADCLYTGIATDSGCFRYSNTTSRTLRTAALLIEKGADSAKLNKLLFETKSRGRIQLETNALATLEYHFGGLAALITLTRDMMKASGVDDSESEGIPAIPAQIKGVVAGITVKEKESGIYKVSLRTGAALNASDICARLGGGGHSAAAGCSIKGSLDEVKRAVLAEVKKEINRYGLKGEGE